MPIRAKPTKTLLGLLSKIGIKNIRAHHLPIPCGPYRPLHRSSPRVPAAPSARHLSPRGAAPAQSEQPPVLAPRSSDCLCSTRRRRRSVCSLQLFPGRRRRLETFSVAPEAAARSMDAEVGRQPDPSRASSAGATPKVTGRQLTGAARHGEAGGGRGWWVVGGRQ